MSWHDFAREFRVYFQNVTLGVGMYGKEWNLSETSKWKARFLSSEDAQSLYENMVIYTSFFSEEYDHRFQSSDGLLSVLSGIRMASHAVRPHIVQLLKQSYGLDQTFPECYFASSSALCFRRLGPTLHQSGMSTARADIVRLFI